MPSESDACQSIVPRSSSSVFFLSSICLTYISQMRSVNARFFVKFLLDLLIQNIVVFLPTLCCGLAALFLRGELQLHGTKYRISPIC
ncbi:hypothetical protein EYF80_026553 [Liparis tanakae]|uniref:Uncharacterized protein n=1 Tax=Liparis tanakae TaxID=230148 RepID=A0A4Z2HCG7_9TELE|nr:hypothetical protein EYF80_026553 [Liparis tanakae]